MQEHPKALPGWEKDAQGVKYDQGKPRYDLLDADAINDLALVATFGAQKYNEHNWRAGIKLSRLLAAAARHLFAIIRGEDFDEETGLPHSAHLMCCAMFLNWTMKNKPSMDDRWKYAETDRQTQAAQTIDPRFDGPARHEQAFGVGTAFPQPTGICQNTAAGNRAPGANQPADKLATQPVGQSGVSR